VAANQVQHHELGRNGEKLAKANGIVKGRLTRHTAPFDVVDFNNRVGYEVKTLSGLGIDLKIHIMKHSWERKLEFASKYGLRMILVAVVIYSEDDIKFYQSELKQHIRINQMRRVV
jgi:hypothetical protein